jgi:hypothetical protein
MTKTPGMSFNLEETELDLTYKSRYKDAVLPEVIEYILYTEKSINSLYLYCQIPATVWYK